MKLKIKNAKAATDRLINQLFLDKECGATKMLCACACVRACVCVCVRACVRVCMHVRMCAYFRVLCGCTPKKVGRACGNGQNVFNGVSFANMQYIPSRNQSC